MRIPEDAPFLRAAFSLRRRSSSSFRFSSDMAGPHFRLLAPLYRCWPAIHSSTIALLQRVDRASRRGLTAPGTVCGETFEPVTMGHIRGHGVTRLLVYCDSLWCNHSATLDADWLPDDTILLTLDRRIVCTE